MPDTKTQSRLREVLQALEAAWRVHPELRLGQLLAIAMAPNDTAVEIFNMHDQELFNRLRALAGNNENISHITPAWGNVFLDLGFPEKEAIAFKGVSGSAILKKLEQAGSRPMPKLPEHHIGETVWIAGVAPHEMTQGKIVHIFERYGQMQYAVEVQTQVDPVLCLRDAWTVADKPDISALGPGRPRLGDRTGEQDQDYSCVLSANKETPMFQQFDVVRLLVDCGPMQRGARGTVVELLDDNTVLVEFVGDNGKTLAELPLAMRILRKS